MPEKYIDLHLHSNASDGTYPPAEVYRRAGGAGLSAFALTDHDSLEGYDEIVGQVDTDLIELVPAIELSGYWKGEDLHILAYLVDPESPELREKLAQFKTNREKRAEAMVEKINGMGVPLEMESVRRAAGRSTIGRPHVAEALIRAGVIKNFDEAFQRFIGARCPAYEPKRYISVPDAIDVIHQAGGLAVFAHPGLLNRDDLLIDLLEMGLDGIEAFHSQHDAYRTNHYIQTAQKYGLVYTGGSDCHGDRKGRPLIGKIKVPYQCLTMLKKAREIRFR
jgi:predicted metal-dependent phosphoesterase TrpH